ncbi:MAG: DMT family transporter [Beijerinckiaceae bacterium]|nr:DMT family transporter [Beijerinckiaceae bacterium]
MPRKSLLVLFWMLGSLVSFAGVALSVRGLQGALTVFEMLAIRNIGGMAILAGMMLLAPGPDQVVRMVRPMIHLLRNAAHFIGQALWVWGVTVLPLATVFAIEFTTPAWVALFAVLFLKERMTLFRGLAIALGFAGVLIILRPGMESFRPEALAVVLAAVFFGIQITTTKFLTGSNATWTIMFWMNLMQLPMNMAANWSLGHSPLILGSLSWDIWLPVLGIAITGFLAHYCLTNAFRHGDATLVVPIDFLRVPLIALIGWLFYAETPELPVLLGALVVIGGVVINLVAEARAKKA